MTKFAFGLQIHWNILNSNRAPQKHPVIVNYKKINVREFKRVLAHW